jgi:glycosidase
MSSPRTFLLSLALALAACDTPSTVGARDGGVTDGGGALRSCATVIRYTPDHSVGKIEIGAEWNQFDPTRTPMTGPDRSGVWTASVTLPPGSYGYKFVLDGSDWRLDPANPYSKYVGGIENSVVEVGDCNQPQLRFIGLDKSAAGAMRARVQYVDGARGAGLDAASIAASTLDGMPALGASVGDGVITVEANGIAKDKHRLIVRAADRAGRAADDLHLPFWIEDQPFDFRDGLLYFAFTDRFRDGDPSNNAPVAGVDARANYAGGDFAGIRAAIEEGYFESLGVRSLWVSPPNANPDHSEPGADGRPYSGYHGYWPTQPRTVQARFGTLDDFRAMVKSAHQHGLRVIVDSVLNHVHKEHPLYVQHQADGWFNGDGSCVCGGANCDWTVHALDCWFMSYLPDLDYRSFDAMKAMIDDALWWAREVDVDGFRVDAVKHFYHAATRRLRSKLHDELEQAGTLYYLVGETFDGDRGLINSFIGPSELSAQFDFPVYFAVRDAIGAGSVSLRSLAQAVKDSDAAFGTAPMSPFLGNHDVPRFVSIAANMIDGDGKEQAWTSPPAAPTDTVPYQKLRLALTFVGTQPGVPLLYYGDEVGEPGTADPDNRHKMRWSGYSVEEQATLAHEKKVGAARRELGALGRGNRVELWIDDDLYVYARVSGASVAVVAINRAATPRTQAVPVPKDVPLADGTMLRDRLGGAAISVGGQSLPLSLPARGSAIYAP